jgi:hypothetical protein
MRQAIILLLLMFAIAAAPAESQATEARIALVLTNQMYGRELGALENTHEDGRLVATALRKVGFDVTLVRDASRPALVGAVSQHVAQLQMAGPKAIGFLYYSGHGAADSADGDNYLIPVDAALTAAAQLPIMAVKLGDNISSVAASGAHANFVVFDACRNVPLVRSQKSPYKGFVPENARRGILIGFATDPGAVAVDENIYARALAEEITKPGMEAAQVFRAVRRRVLEATKGRQFPWTREGLIDDFHFASSVPVSTSNPPPPATVATPSALRPLPNAIPASPPTHQPIPHQIAIPTNTFFKGQTGAQSFVLVGRWVGARVQGSRGVHIGEVHAIILEGEVTVGVIIEVGRYLGVGLKKIGVRIGAVKIATIDGKVNITLPAASKELLAALGPYQWAPPARQ